MTYTMCTPHTYSLPGNVEISFTDSGVPRADDSVAHDDYTTLIIIHGAAFTGESMAPIHTHSPTLNLRTVILTCRGYPGSTPFSEQELADQANGDTGFMKGLGAVMKDFLKEFISREGIPKAGEGRGSGGVVILGWSAGCIQAMSLFWDPDTRIFEDDEEGYELLKGYVSGLVLYDPPTTTFGCPNPPASVCDKCNLYVPFTDPAHADKSFEEKLKLFPRWVAAYYDHNIEFDSKGMKGVPEGLSSDSGSTGKEKKNSLDGWTEEDWKRLIKLDSAMNSDFRMLTPLPQKTLRKLKDCFFFDLSSDDTNKSTRNSKNFPNVRITYLLASKGTWNCNWTAHEIHRTFHEYRLQNQTSQRKNDLPVKRWINFTVMKGGNHFVHLDFTHRFLEITKNALLAPDSEELAVEVVSLEG
ncbi:hypothetical protein D9758_010371 [Tetrapyrgos nigripes]|uniref:AB hydrolase-1 domain-containing protein n=1 Tax=Tetrapyrgos nigripes TaxID=182062 RepID=A0A8H5D291_9AGAR|nr:hypothetical protein D9758_010371 [Tetrapyrgos nigripes]